ncbi:hypothetical protein [Pluralibacter gergoviae]|uniref:hypothetical protein n=1 Tax=Pluralibacter gergoviae TaxID=61647 RepID=UPI001926C2F8|nr:hypothetical protein [Pluralibacter gergoviae]MBL3693230.1 hypothetical protein [Pluralibacter gergoviae]
MAKRAVRPLRLSVPSRQPTAVSHARSGSCAARVVRADSQPAVCRRRTRRRRRRASSARRASSSVFRAASARLSEASACVQTAVSACV